MNMLTAAAATNKVEVRHLQGIEVILSCMREHPESVIVQTQGCSVLQNLTASDGAYGAFRSEPHAAGAPSRCARLSRIPALMSHPVPNRDHVNDCDGIQTIVDAVVRHRDSPEVLKEALGALQNLCAEHGATGAAHGLDGR